MTNFVFTPGLQGSVPGGSSQLSNAANGSGWIAADGDSVTVLQNAFVIGAGTGDSWGLEMAGTNVNNLGLISGTTVGVGQSSAVAGIANGS